MRRFHIAPDLPYTYPITIEHIFVSPGHNYFGRPKDGPGDYPTFEVDKVEARAGKGLVGDRHFATPAHYDAQVTFVAAEVFDLLRAAHGDSLSPVLMRRNVVVRGVPLNQLIGRTFSIETGEGQQRTTIRFEGRSHCAPCAWMDAMIAPGAQTMLRGRGGLRARILDDGVLGRGPALLAADLPLDLDRLLNPIQRPRLPD